MAGDCARVFYVPAGQQNRPPSDVPLEVIPPKGPTIRGHRFSLDQTDASPLLKNVGPNTIFHIHGLRQPLLVSVTRGLRRRGLPYVLTSHSRYAHIFNRNGKLEHRKTAAYVYLLERPFLEKARFIHALTTLEAEEVRRLVPRANIHIVQNGVFSSSRDKVPAAPEARPPRAYFPVFGYFGRLAIEHKGLDLLVAGFARYKLAGGAGTLQIMGTGDDARRALAQLAAEAGIASHVSILEPRFGAQKNAVVASWDFFVMPSRFDRMPLAALEAGLLGLPLVLTDETGIDVEHHQAGLRIARSTPDAVAASLAEAARLTPQDWLEKARGAHRMVFSTADWTALAEQLRQFYAMPAYPRAPEAEAGERRTAS